MGLTPEDRAAQVVGDLESTLASLDPATAQNLEWEIARAIRHAIESDRADSRVTLRFCIETFNEMLSLAETLRHLLAAVRVSRGLCLEELGEAASSGTAESPRAHLRSLSPKDRPRS